MSFASFEIPCFKLPLSLLLGFEVENLAVVFAYLGKKRIMLRWWADNYIEFDDIVFHQHNFHENREILVEQKRENLLPRQAGMGWGLSAPVSFLEKKMTHTSGPVSIVTLKVSFQNGACGAIRGQLQNMFHPPMLYLAVRGWHEWLKKDAYLRMENMTVDSLHRSSNCNATIINTCGYTPRPMSKFLFGFIFLRSPLNSS